MPKFKQTPASARYLRARLQVFKRPMVWGAAAALIVAILLVGEYLANPQQYTSGADLDPSTSPPNQDHLPIQAGATSQAEVFETLTDLSKLPNQDGSLQSSGGTTALKNSTSQDAADSSLLQQLLLGQSLPSFDAKEKTTRRSSSQVSPFSAPASPTQQENRTRSTGLPSLYPSPPSAALPSAAFSSPSVSGDAAGSTAVNPLQSALDRYSARQPDASASPLAAPSPAPTSGFGNSDFAIDPAAAIDESELSSQRFTPQISPSPGTTGYTLPSTLRTPDSSSSGSSYSSGATSQPIPGAPVPQIAPPVPSQSLTPSSYRSPSTQPAYGQPSSYQSAPSPTIASPAAATPPPSPFSIRRTIGNGEIDTFSNP